ncbi:DUF6090 family protein [Microcosmobacter mediterraneus]
MITFFRRLRQKLLSENKFSKYLMYAIGEIILVVIGILIALQVNNWNEKRKAKAKFTNTIEQVYNALDSDYNYFSRSHFNLGYQMKLIDSLIYHPLKVNRELLPFYVFYSQIKPSDQFKSEVNFYLDNLEFDTNNLKESNLIKNISSYGSQVQTDYFNDNEANFIAPFLKEINVANPVLIFGFSALNNFSSVNNSFFNIQHQEQMLELIQTESFRNALISTNRQNELILIFISDYMDDIYYNMKSVKDYEPGVKLFYNNVGVLGSATTNGWEKSIPMTLIDAKLNIWEIKIVLKEGGVKFRTNESWTTNWGGETFPKGECIYFGDNIEVKEAGYYHIRLDLLKKNYQFIPIEND